MTTTRSAGRAATAARRSFLVEAAALAAVTMTVAAAYLLTHAPLYNPAGTIDPWLYTALWTNFDQVYHHFAQTYYVSRVPWIAPGYAANLLFGARGGYFVTHVAFFFGCAGVVYAACRRHLGVAPALTAYAGLIGDQMYFNGHRWDYEEGASLAFLAAAVSFAVPRTRSTAWRIVSLFLSGFFATAAVTTRLTESVYLAIGLPLLYALVVLLEEQSRRLRAVAGDVAAFVGGVFVLVALGGVFSTVHDNQFFFFIPQIRTTFTANSEGIQQPLSMWFSREPYFWIPVFVVGAAVAVLVAGRPVDRHARRFLIGSAAWTAASFAIVALWEFVGSGFLFEYEYYFSSFLIPSALCAAAVAAALFERASPRLAVIFVALVAAAVVAPLLWIYASDDPSRIADGVDWSPYVAMTASMAIAIGLLLLWPRVKLAAITGAAAVTVFGAVSYGADASQATWLYGHSDSRTGDLYALAQQLKTYLRANGFSDDLPYFWYANTPSGVSIALQSYYYYSFTYIGLGLPKIDADFRARLRLFHPGRLVLVCEQVDCSGAGAALRSAGYTPRLVSHTRLTGRRLRVWVRIYRVRSEPRPGAA